jgi:hypothetical protein
MVRYRGEHVEPIWEDPEWISAKSMVCPGSIYQETLISKLQGF